LQTAGIESCLFIETTTSSWERRGEEMGPSERQPFGCWVFGLGYCLSYTLSIMTLSHRWLS